MARATRTGRTAFCARGPIRSRAAPPRSSRTSLPSACSVCRGCGDGLTNSGSVSRQKPMNFELTDDQSSIKRTARELLAARYRPETVRELAADERGFSDEQWQELAELGWPGVVVPE